MNLVIRFWKKRPATIKTGTLNWLGSLWWILLFVIRDDDDDDDDDDDEATIFEPESVFSYFFSKLTVSWPGQAALALGERRAGRWAKRKASLVWNGDRSLPVPWWLVVVKLKSAFFIHFSAATNININNNNNNKKKKKKNGQVLNMQNHFFTYQIHHNRINETAAH